MTWLFFKWWKSTSASFNRWDATFYMARCESDNITSLWSLKNAIYIQEVNKQRLYFFYFIKLFVAWSLKDWILCLFYNHKKNPKNVIFKSCVYVFFSVSWWVLLRIFCTYHLHFRNLTIYVLLLGSCREFHMNILEVTCD